MRHASLFTGIGGFDYAAAMIGWENVFQVEKDTWCNQLLALRFPNTERYFDIREFSGEKYRGKIDIISGGFPCQPFSVAGKQKGTADDRYLWKEMLRVISEVRPAWVVGENVAGIASIFKFDMSSPLEGKVYSSAQEARIDLDKVCERRGTNILYMVIQDLEKIGYSVQTFDVPACGVNAKHRRSRVWIVAHNDSTSADNKVQTRRNVPSGEDAAYSDEYCKPNCTEHDRKVEFSQNPGLRNGSRSNEQGETPKADRTESSNEPKFSISSNTQRINSHTTGKRLETAGKPERQMCTEPDKEEETSDVVNEFYGDSNGISWSGQWSELDYQRQIRLPSRKNSGWRTLEWPTEPALCGANDGISRRVDRLKGLGNAIVPQVAMQIFEAINIIHNSQ